MRIGAILPQMELGVDLGAMRAVAEAAHALGYAHLLAYEHVLGVDPTGRADWRGTTHEQPFREPFVLFGFLAAIAPGMELATGVLVLPQRPTALVAKQAAEVDLLTGGRLRLGVGVGHNRVEYAALGQPYARRGRRCDEQIALLRELWTRPLVSFDGEFDRIDRAGINPLPVQRPIPIWIGGDSEAAMRRAGALGDGWFPHGRPGPELAVRIEAVRRIAAEAGRDPDAVGVETRITLGDVPEDDWAAELDRWRAMPHVTHLGVETLGAGFTRPEQHVRALERFAALAGLTPRRNAAAAGEPA